MWEFAALSAGSSATCSRRTGIKALGEAKLRLLEYDTQDSAEKARTAQRLLARMPMWSAASAAGSPFTLAVTG
jgi:hypothetical protein